MSFTDDTSKDIHERFYAMLNFAKELIKENPDDVEELSEHWKGELMELLESNGLTEDDKEYFKGSSNRFGRPSFKTQNGTTISLARGELVQIVYLRNKSDEELEDSYKGSIQGLSLGVSMADLQFLQFIEREMFMRTYFSCPEKMAELQDWNENWNRERTADENQQWAVSLLKNEMIVNHWLCDSDGYGNTQMNGCSEFLILTGEGEYYSVLGQFAGGEILALPSEPTIREPTPQDLLTDHIGDETNEFHPVNVRKMNIGYALSPTLCEGESDLPKEK